MEHNEYNMYLSKEERMRAVLPFMPEAVVVGNGDFPSHPFPLAVLDASPCVVCCDGGADALVDSGRVPGWIVGDGDSLSETNRVRFHDRIHRISEQETNDQTKAVTFLAAKGIRRMVLVGAYGQAGRPYLGKHQPAHGIPADGSGGGDADRLRVVCACRRYGKVCGIPSPAGICIQCGCGAVAERRITVSAV